MSGNRRAADVHNNISSTAKTARAVLYDWPGGFLHGFNLPSFENRPGKCSLYLRRAK